MGLVAVTVQCDRLGCPSFGTVPSELPRGWTELVRTTRSEQGVQRAVLLLCELCSRDVSNVLDQERQSIDLVAFDLERVP